MIIPFLFCCLAVRHQLSVAPLGVLFLRPRRTPATRAAMTMARLPGMNPLASLEPAVARSPLVPK
ncbi:MAG: hypothetical protein ACRD19_09215 [Terriglobia bacterium]